MDETIEEIKKLLENYGLPFDFADDLVKMNKFNRLKNVSVRAFSLLLEKISKNSISSLESCIALWENKEDNFGKENFIKRYKLTCITKFHNRYVNDAFHCDLDKLLVTFEKINNNPKVYFFDNYIAFRLINIYLDIRILIDYLNYFSQTYHPEKKKIVNMFYYMAETGINFIEEELDDISNKNAKYQFRYSQDASILLPIKKTLKDVVEKMISKSRNELNRKMATNILIDGAFDNIRIMEKFIFPILYDTLILNAEITNSEYAPKFDAKRNILFDILPVILNSNRIEPYELSAYENEYQYRVKTTKVLFGI